MTNEPKPLTTAEIVGKMNGAQLRMYADALGVRTWWERMSGYDNRTLRDRVIAKAERQWG